MKNGKECRQAGRQAGRPREHHCAVFFQFQKASGMAESFWWIRIISEENPKLVSEQKQKQMDMRISCLSEECCSGKNEQR